MRSADVALPRFATLLAPALIVLRFTSFLFLVLNSFGGQSKAKSIRQSQQDEKVCFVLISFVIPVFVTPFPLPSPSLSTPSISSSCQGLIDDKTDQGPNPPVLFKHLIPPQLLLLDHTGCRKGKL